MQKLTLLFIYGQDEERRLRYRVTDDMPVGVMIEKLIGFQFVIDSADPKTFRVMHNGTEITDLTQTFEQSSVADGDEIYLIPTVFEPIPPLPENDAPIVPNVGMFASMDPVALDAACADAVNRQPVLAHTALTAQPRLPDYFDTVHPDTNWRVQLTHGEQIGLGTVHYELIQI